MFFRGGFFYFLKCPRQPLNMLLKCLNKLYNNLVSSLHFNPSAVHFLETQSAYYLICRTTWNHFTNFWPSGQWKYVVTYICWKLETRSNVQISRAYYLQFSRHDVSLKPTLVIQFEMESCLQESVVKRSHVTAL